MEPAPRWTDTQQLEPQLQQRSCLATTRTLVDIHIRGALGTQIFDLAYGLSRFPDAGSVVINTGGPVVNTVKRDWITPLFDLGIPVIQRDGKSKQAVWEHPDRMLDLSRCDIKKLLPLRRLPTPNNLRVLHVRGLDRQLLHADIYVRLIHQLGPDVTVLGDDPDLIRRVIDAAGGGQYLEQEPIEDWYTCMGARELYSGFTNFTLSAMLFDPIKTFRMVSRDATQGPASISKSVWLAVQHLFDNYFSNADWINP